MAMTSRVDTLPVYEEATFTPRWIPADALDTTEVHTIPDFALTNQQGEAISQETFDGHVYIADFFFTTCPGICKDMTENMAKLQATLADHPEVFFLSHSVTPKVDTVEVLAAYGKLHGVDPNRWHLATGDRDQIYTLGRDHYFVEEDQGLDKSPDDFLHTENFVLIDDRRRIRGIYNGLNPTALSQLATDVATLEAERKKRIR